MVANNITQVKSVFIDIERINKKRQQLQEHIKENPKDEKPKIKAKQLSAKIKRLLKYAERKKISK
jgi:ribosomal protein S15P/S13E